MSFEAKTAVVTGAGGGMGFRIAQRLIERGAKVACIDLKSRPDALDANAATYHQGDLTDEPFVQRVMQETFDATGRLDYLVNAAGLLWFGRDKSLLEVDLETWDRVIAVNLKSMVLTTRHAVPLMRKTGGGAMVHFSSTQALRGDDKPQDAYQAAKAAIINLSKSLAVNLGPDGIRSNTLIPGPAETPMQDRWQADPDLKAKTASAVPLRRVGNADDMANATLFLLSDEAAYITGTELVVDGGRTAMP